MIAWRRSRQPGQIIIAAHVVRTDIGQVIVIVHRTTVIEATWVDSAIIRATARESRPRRGPPTSRMGMAAVLSQRSDGVPTARLCGNVGVPAACHGPDAEIVMYSSRHPTAKKVYLGVSQDPLGDDDDGSCEAGVVVGNTMTNRSSSGRTSATICRWLQKTAAKARVSSRAQVRTFCFDDSVSTEVSH